MGGANAEAMRTEERLRSKKHGLQPPNSINVPLSPVIPSSTFVYFSQLYR